MHDSNHVLYSLFMQTITFINDIDQLWCWWVAPKTLSMTKKKTEHTRTPNISTLPKLYAHNNQLKFAMMIKIKSTLSIRISNCYYQKLENKMFAFQNFVGRLDMQTWQHLLQSEKERKISSNNNQKPPNLHRNCCWWVLNESLSFSHSACVRVCGRVFAWDWVHIQILMCWKWWTSYENHLNIWKYTFCESVYCVLCMVWMGAKKVLITRLWLLLGNSKTQNVSN